MGSFLQILLHTRVFRPVIRLALGLIAIPLFRFFLKRVVRLQDLDDELEKDLEQWFRGSLLLLASTAVMEEALFGWAPIQDELLMGLRIMLAIGVIETMPDQNLFAIVHPGPPKIKYDRSRSIWSQVCEHDWPVMRGLICRHINRSSPVFAILSAIAPGGVGWFCYFAAILQYLVIGLVTSRDKALGVLSEFDRQVAVRRQEIIDEFHIEEQGAGRSTPAPTSNAEHGRSQTNAASAGVDRCEAIVAKVDEGGYVTK